MSPQLNYQIARARQNEIAAHTAHAHHRPDAESTTKPRRPITQRIARILVPVGVSLAATAGVMVNVAQGSPQPASSASHVSAQQVAREIGALEAKGYVQTSCVVGGTLMRSSRTGQTRLVRW
jgi:hypothetical protein